MPAKHLLRVVGVAVLFFSSTLYAAPAPPIDPATLPALCLNHREVNAKPTSWQMGFAYYNAGTVGATAMVNATLTGTLQMPYDRYPADATADVVLINKRPVAQGTLNWEGHNVNGVFVGVDGAANRTATSHIAKGSAAHTPGVKAGTVTLKGFEGVGPAAWDCYTMPDGVYAAHHPHIFVWADYVCRPKH